MSKYACELFYKMDCHAMFMICGKEISNKQPLEKKPSSRNPIIRSQPAVLPSTPKVKAIYLPPVLAKKNSLFKTPKMPVKRSQSRTPILSTSPSLTVQISYENSPSRFFPPIYEEKVSPIQWAAEFPAGKRRENFIKLIENILADKIALGASGKSYPLTRNTYYIKQHFLSASPISLARIPTKYIPRISPTPKPGFFPVVDSAFLGINVAPIAIHDYIERLVKHIHLYKEALITMLVLLERFLDRSENQFLHNYSVHRLLLGAAYIAAAWLEDDTFTKELYSRVGGVPLPNVKAIICQFLNGVDNNAFVTVEEFEAMQALTSESRFNSVPLLKEVMPDHPNKVIAIIDQYMGWGARPMGERTRFSCF